jgi:diacylglycerol kinase family enzyme
MARTVIVVNPRSGGGRTGARLDELRALATPVLGDVEVWPTGALGDGSRQAEAAARAGAEVVIACGGDGTASEVVDGLLRVAGPRPVLGLLPAGTGSDLARTLGMPSGWPEALRAIAAAAPRPTDAIRATFTARDGTKVVRHGINVVGVGLAGDIVRRVNASGKRLGGTLTFLGATVTSLLRWRAPVARVAWTDPEGFDRVWAGRLMNVFVANGRYCGSGMCVDPAGTMDDGVLGVAIVPELPRLRALRELPRLYDGTLVESDALVTGRATRLRVWADGGGWIPGDLDGEGPGGTPVEVEVVPGVLRVVAPWAPPLRAA